MTRAAPTIPIITPCTKVCTLDTRSGWCLGCGRTGEEIARWASMTPSQRDEIMQMLSDRMQVLSDRLAWKKSEQDL